MRQFITSMDEAGYNVYGRKFLERAAECLPGEVLVYTEDEPFAEEQPGVTWRNLNEVSGYQWFRKGVSTFPAMQGIIDNSGRRVYKYDIYRFCHKIFAQLDAAAAHQDEMWWIDADIEFSQPIPERFFQDALRGVFMAYLGRPSWHSCASLVGYNNAHPQASEYWSTYMSLMITGSVLLLGEWHDSYINDQIRTKLSVLARDMAIGCDLKDGPVNVFDEVLGEYAHHKKGNIKHRVSRYQQLIDLVRERQPKRILEIGTWNGGRALEMHQVSPESQYIGFDLFELADDETDKAEKNVKPHHKANDVAKRLQDNGVDYELFAGFSDESLKMYLDKYGEGSADFIFIDGGHSVSTIRSDLDYALQIIEEGGLIVLDDYYEDMDDIDQFGCNVPLEESGLEYEVLPAKDPVKGGGTTQMAIVEM